MKLLLNRFVLVVLLVVFAASVIEAQTDPSKSIASGTGLASGVVGHMRNFSIEARDSAGFIRPSADDFFEVSFTGTSSFTGFMTNKNNGKQLGTYLPMVAGSYSAAVAMRGPSTATAYGLSVTEPNYAGTTSITNLKVVKYFTIEAWFKTTQLAAGNGIIGFNLNGYGLRLSLGKVECYATVAAGASSDFIPVESLEQKNDGQWHHAACVKGADDVLVLYVDGGLQDSAAAAGDIYYTGVTEFNVGRSYTTGTFAGQIDEVRVWSTSRTVAEITANYNRDLSGSTSGLVSFWKFNDGTGIIASNAVGSGVSLTLNGATWTSSVPTLNYDTAVGLPNSPFSVTINTDQSPITGSGKTAATPSVATGFSLQAQDGDGMDEKTGGKDYSFTWTKLNPDSTTGTVSSVSPVDNNNGTYDFDYTISERAVFRGSLKHEGPIENLGALQFAGNTVVKFGNPAAALLDTFTVELWFKSGSSAIQTLFRGQEPYGYWMRLEGGDVKCYAANLAIKSGVIAGTTSGGYADNNWHHAACTFQTGDQGLILYVDGAAKSNNSLHNSLSFKPSLGTAMGGEVLSSSRYYSGYLDEVRLWSSIRTGSEIVQYMNRALVGNEANLAGYWPMDEGMGARVHDKTANHIDGVITNGAWLTTGLIALKLPSALDIKESPFLMCCDYPTVPAKTTASGSGLAGGDACVLKEFIVQAYNTNNDTRICSFDKVTAEFTGPQALLSIVEAGGIFSYNGQYNVSYFPVKIGTYTLDVKLDGVSIIGNTFTTTIVPGEPNATQSFGYGPNLFQGVAGEFSTVYIQAVDACGNNRTSEAGAYSAALAGPATLTLPLVYSGADGLYKAVYNLTTAGAYAMDMKLGSVHLPGSPFQFTQKPAVTDVTKTWIYGPGISSTVAGAGSYFNIQARDVFLNNQTHENDNFAIQFSGPSTVTPTVQHLSSGIHSVVYNITTAGSYQIAVTLDSVHVPGSPFTLTVATAPTYPPACNISGAGFLAAEAGIIGEFYITAWDRFGNQKPNSDDAWSVKLVGTVTVTADVVGLGNGLYRAKYNSTVADTFSLEVTLDSVHAAGSPKQLYVEPGPTDGAHCVASAEINTASAGANNTFYIQARDRFDNDRTKDGDDFIVQITGPETITLNKVYLGKAKYIIFYTGTKNGDFVISARLSTNGVHILGSPFNIHIYAGPVDTTVTTVTGDGLATTRIAGTIGALALVSKDKFGNIREATNDPFVIQAVSSKATVNADMISTSQGNYAINYNATVAGSYQLKVTFNSVNVASSPYGFILLPNVTNTRSCITSGTAASNPIAGELSLFSIFARDAFGNNVTISGDNFIVAITGPATTPTTLTHVDQGIYQVTFNQTLAGKYSLDVKRDTENIYDSPSVLTVHPAPAYGPNSYILPGAVFNYSMVVGEGYLHPFTVQGVDFWGNNRTQAATEYMIKMDGPVVSYGVTTYLGNGQYKCIQNATVPGTYSLSITVYGLNLIGSPMPGQITVEIGPPYGIACLPWGGGEKVAVAGEYASLYVQTRDAYGNNRTTEDGHFNMTLTGLEVVGPRTLIYIGDGVHSTTYRIYKAGPYKLNIKFSYDNLYVFGGNIPVLGQSTTPNITKSYAYGPGLTDAQAGILNPFYVQIVDIYDNNATYSTDNVAFTVTKSGFTQQGLVQGTGAGIHTCTFNVTVPSQYQLSVTANSEVLPGSPFTTTVIPGPANGARSQASGTGLLASQTAGVNGLISIISFDAFGNQRTGTDDTFSVQLVGPATVNGVVTAMSNGQYKASYNATVSGTYQLTIMVNSQHVAGSPYTITVNPNAVYAPQCVVSGDAATSGTAGISGMFYLQARDIFGNKIANKNLLFVVVLKANDGGATSVPAVTPVVGDDGNYSVTYTSTYAGAFTVTVQYELTNIKNSPWAFTMAPSTFELGKVFLTSGHTEAEAGIVTDVLIQSADKYGNKRFTEDATYVLRLVGPQTVGPVTATYTGSGVSKASYYITKIGSYLLYVESGGVGITGSPFTVPGVSGPVNLTQSFIYSFTLGSNAGDYSSVWIQLKDSVDNNRTKSDTVLFTYTVTTPAGTEYGNEGTYYGNGLYFLRLMHRKAGSVVLVKIMVNGQQLDSTRTIAVVNPGPRDLSNTLAYGPLVDGGEEHYPLGLYLQERDQFNNTVTTGGNYTFVAKWETTSLPLTELSTGLYNANYTVPAKGTFKLYVYLTDGVTNIYNSPFTVVITAYTPIVASQSRIANPSATIFEVSYDAATDRAGKTGSFSCDSVLEPDTVTLLGTKPWCTFRDSKTLGIFVGNGYTIAAASSIKVKSGTTKNIDGDSGYVAAKTTTVAASSYGTPDAHAVIVGTPYVGTCGKIELDASGSYGGKTITTYAWALQSAVPAASGLEDTTLAVIASGTSSAVFSVWSSTSHGLRTGVTYTFKLTVTNNYGKTDFTTFNVTRIDAVIPIVAMLGNPVQSVVTTRNHDIATILKNSDCMPTGAAVKYSWDVSSLGLSMVSSSSLLIPANTLLLGNTYALKLDVWFSTNTSNKAMIPLSLTGMGAPLAAIIAGGNRTQPASQAIALDGSVSVPTAATKTFAWECKDSTGATCTAVASEMALTTSTVTIASGKLSAGAYSFSLTVVSDGVTSKTTVVITLSGSTIPALKIAEPYFYVAAGEQVAITAGSDLAVAFAWTVDGGAGSAVVEKSTTESGLVVLTDSCGGQRIKVTVEGTSGSMKGTATAEILVAVPALAGTCSASPSSGYQNSTFALTCAGWQNDDESILFNFRALGEGSFAVPLGPLSLKPSLSVLLPSGAPTTVVYDIVGGSTGSRASFKSTVTVNSLTALGLSAENAATAILDAKADAAVASGDCSQLGQILLTATALLNGGTVTSDNILLRRRILTLAQSCSSSDKTVDGIELGLYLTSQLASKSSALDATTAASLVNNLAASLSSASRTGFTSSTLSNLMATTVSNILSSTATDADMKDVFIKLQSAVQSLVQAILFNQAAGGNAVVLNTEKFTLTTYRAPLATLQKTFVSLNNTVTGGIGAGVSSVASSFPYTDVLIAGWGRNPHGWSNLSVLSKVITITLLNPSGSVISGDSTSDLINFKSKFTALPANENEKVGCVWWDASSSVWSTTGCTAVTDTATMLAECKCVHTTDFSMRMVPNLVCKVRVDAAYFYVTIILIVVSIIGLIIGVVLDQAEAKYLVKRPGHSALVASSRAAAKLSWDVPIMIDVSWASEFWKCWKAVTSFHHTLFGIAPAHGVGVQFLRPERVLVALASLMTAALIMVGFTTDYLNLFDAVYKQHGNAVVAALGAVIAGILWSSMFIQLAPPGSKAVSKAAVKPDNVGMQDIGPGGDVSLDIPTPGENDQPGACCGRAYNRSTGLVVFFYFLIVVYIGLTVAGTLVWAGCLSYAQSVEWLVWLIISIVYYAFIFEILKTTLITIAMIIGARSRVIPPKKQDEKKAEGKSKTVVTGENGEEIPMMALDEEGESSAAKPPVDPLVAKSLESLQDNEYDELEAGADGAPVRKLPGIGGKTGVAGVAGFKVEGESGEEQGFVPRSPWEEEEGEDELAMARRFRQTAYGELNEKQIVKYFIDASKPPEHELPPAALDEEEEEGKEKEKENKEN